jgi:ABC-type polysaccharide/polyol phosphate transport system ATPase subunit
MQGKIVIKLVSVNFSFLITGQGITSLKEYLHRALRGKGFHRRQVLNDVNFDVRKGECFAILGRNGSGKSTLLRILSGIIEPDSGVVNVDGKVAPILALGVGLEPELSGFDNIRLCGTLTGVSSKNISSFECTVIEFSELSKEDLDLQVKRFSTGMTARLAFSIAIAQNPDILIVDEVLAVGDKAFQDKCYQRIDELKQQGCTILFVSHSEADVRRICNRGIVLEHGKISASGDIDDIITFYNRSIS